MSCRSLLLRSRPVSSLCNHAAQQNTNVIDRFSTFIRRRLSTAAAMENNEPHRSTSSSNSSSGSDGTSHSKANSIQQKEYHEDAMRCGVYAIKVGMTQLWDSWGVRHGVTILLMDNVQVTKIMRNETHGYTALQVAAGETKPKNVSPRVKGLYQQAGVEPKRIMGEFRISPDAILPVGLTLRAQHFVPGQLVDVQGISRGRGFQGAMKRWGFKGQRASHGVSKTHRHIGSTGQCQDPGRVFKGKKMAGRQGGETATEQCLRIMKIDTLRDVLYVKGNVPGNRGAFVKVKDSIKGSDFPIPPPFPTFVPNAGEEYADELIAPPLLKDDPMAYLETE